MGKSGLVLNLQSALGDFSNSSHVQFRNFEALKDLVEIENISMFVHY